MTYLGFSKVFALSQRSGRKTTAASRRKRGGGVTYLVTLYGVVLYSDEAKPFGRLSTRRLSCAVVMSRRQCDLVGG
jgi:hypothetical protein